MSGDGQDENKGDNVDQSSEKQEKEKKIVGEGEEAIEVDGIVVAVEE